MAHESKPEGVPVPTVVISVIAVFVAGLLIGGFVLRFGSKGTKDCPEGAAAGPAGAAAKGQRYRIYPRPHNPAKGPRSALVTIIEASDYQCPHCRKGHETMKKIMKAYPRDVRVVYMHMPSPRRPDSRMGSIAAMAAKNQGKFWQFTDLLYRNQRRMKKPDLQRYAKQLGLDMAKFQKDMQNRRMQIQITQDTQQLRRLGVRGTPAYFVNGVYVQGARPFSHFKQVIDKEIRHAKNLLAKGTSRGQLYRELMRGAAFRIGGKGKDDKGQQRRRPPREDPNAVYKVDVEKAPYLGVKNAKVTIAMYSEFQCPWCKRFKPVLDQVMKKYGKDVRFTWFNFPLRFHKQAMPAAIAAMEVFKQKGNKAFWAFHDKVFENNKNITDENLGKWAKEVGANAKKVVDAVKNKTHEKAIRAEMMAGQRIGVRGTPTVIINGKKLRGRRTLQTMSAAIDAEIKKAGAIIGKGGVTVANYYAHIQKKGLTRVKYLPGQEGGQQRRRPPRRRLDPNAIYKVTLTGKSPWKGAKNPLVTIVEWSDYQCPYCKFAACIANYAVKAFPNDVKLVFKHNPLGFHKDALPAAEASMAAFAQKGNAGFWAFHDKLFPMEKCAPKPPMPHIRQWLRGLPRPGPKLDRARFETIAKGMGLNMARFKKDLDGHTHQKQIKEEQAFSNKLGARGTPAFFINGKYLRGVRPFPKFKELLQKEIDAAKKFMAQKKIPRAKLYQALIAKGATAPVYLKDAGGGAAGRPQPRKLNIRPRRGRPPGR